MAAVHRLLLVVSLPWLAAAQFPPDYQARVQQLEESVAARPSDLEALDALASSYAMGGQYARAAAVVARMITVGGDRPEWQLRLARLHAWGGKSGEAIHGFAGYLAGRPEDRAATIELIRIQEYRGDYGPAEALCNRWLRAHAADAEVLALKAEVLHWAGNRRKLERQTAERALALAPALPAARIAQIYALLDQGERREAAHAFVAWREQIQSGGGIPRGASYADAYQLIETTLRGQDEGSLTPITQLYDDSDGIHDSLAGIHLWAPLVEDFGLTADFNHYRSSAPPGSAFVLERGIAERNDISAGAIWRLSPEIDAQFSGGTSWRSASGKAPRPIYDFRLPLAPADHWTFVFSSSREFLNVTPRAIDLDMGSYKVDGRLTYTPDALTSLSGHVERRYWTDQNCSVFADGLFRRTFWYRKGFKLHGLAETWWEDFDHDTHMTAGFFTPVGYHRQDAGLGIHGELGHTLVYDIRGVGGAQQISQGADYQPTWQATAEAGVQLTRGLRLYTSYERRNYTLLSQHGWYQGVYVSLELRRTGETR
jgi:tetratricopeptide (TPR) repeat protein